MARGWFENSHKLKQTVEIVKDQQASQSSQHSADIDQADTDNQTASNAASQLQELQGRISTLQTENERLRAAKRLTETRHEEPANAASPMVTVRSECYRLRYNASVQGDTAESGAACGESGLSDNLPREQLHTSSVVQ